MKILEPTQFGNPVLRTKARRLTHDEILSDDIQALIGDIQHTLDKKQYGVGMAAPQVGESIALTIIGIKPTPSRPAHPHVDMVVINPEIIKTYGEKEPKWEGCLSFGGATNFPYALVPRYSKIRLRWLDETAKLHERDFEGIAAHVLQHETDHLNGILFVDRVEDTTSYMTIEEYKKRFVD